MDRHSNFCFYLLRDWPRTGRWLRPVHSSPGHSYRCTKLRIFSCRMDSALFLDNRPCTWKTLCYFVYLHADADHHSSKISLRRASLCRALHPGITLSRRNCCPRRSSSLTLRINFHRHPKFVQDVVVRTHPIKLGQILRKLDRESPDRAAPPPPWFYSRDLLQTVGKHCWKFLGFSRCADLWSGTKCIWVALWFQDCAVPRPQHSKLMLRKVIFEVDFYFVRRWDCPYRPAPIVWTWSRDCPTA